MNALDEFFATHRDARSFAALYVNYLGDLLKQLDFDAVAAFVDVVLAARARGSRIFFMGNGGSAATASHFANDLAIGIHCPEKPVRAVSLTDNVATMTAIANDDGYDQVFVKQLAVLMEPGDVVAVISASGNSPSVVKAVEFAKARGNHTVALTGFATGGQVAALADTVVHVKTRPGEYGPVEDAHMVLDHLLASYLNRAIAAERRDATGSGR